jgi:ELWxxDGT repeat protein
LGTRGINIRAMVKRIQVVFPLLILISSFLAAQEIIRVSDLFYAPKELNVFNNKLVFLANDSAGVNFWQYDGINPPVRYPDLNNSDFGVPYHSESVEFHHKLYFSFLDGHSASDLWRFDGISPPEVITVPSAYISASHNFAVVDSLLYFNSNDQVHGQELWVYDEIHPPYMVADILPEGSEHGISSNPFFLTAFGNKVCFVAEDGVHGNELWQYDGINPARIVEDIHAGPDDSYISHLTLFKNRLFFAADDGIHGRELWMYDGTHDPVLVSDLYSGSTSSNPNSLISFKGKLYFNAQDDLHGKRLWSFDGMNQPALISDSYVGSADYDPVSMIIFNDKLYFSGRGENENGELWEYDGFAEPVRITDFGTDLVYDTKPRNLTLNANRLYFTVGLNLWSFDGIHQPVQLVKLNYNSQPSHAVFEPNLISMNNSLYMISFDPEKKEGIYVLSNAHSELEVATCGSYEFNGQILTQPGTYVSTIPNYIGADSIITLTLSFNSLNTEVMQDQSELISKDSIGAHQWIDCGNGCVPIEGATGRIFKAGRDGHYAVIVSNGQCVDTSGVFDVMVTGTVENTFERNIILYPNPTEGQLTLDLGKEYPSVIITIAGAGGRIVQKNKLVLAGVTSINIPEPAGIYMVTIVSGHDRAVFRIVKR